LSETFLLKLAHLFLLTRGAHVFAVVDRISIIFMNNRRPWI